MFASLVMPLVKPVIKVLLTIVSVVVTCTSRPTLINVYNAITLVNLVTGRWKPTV
jgi:hypothetical protein